jgi:uncharacterized Zn finger protein
MTGKALPASCPQCGSLMLSWRAVFAHGQRLNDSLELECRQCGLTWTETVNTDARKGRDDPKNPQ